MKKLLLATLLTLSTSALGSAHDFWLEPKTFRPEANSILAVHVLVGHGVERTPFLRREDHIQRFVLVGPGGEKPIVGRPDSDPAGLVRLDQEGILIVGYRSNPSRVELLPDKFEAYLREEGLEHILDQRDELGELTQVGRESYSRCAKALIAVGKDDAGFDRRLGFELEFVPENNPFQLLPDQSGESLEELRVRLLHIEKPLAEALVDIQSLDELTLCLKTRTDAEGRLSLALPRPGRWLLTTTQMQRAPAESDHEWVSLWASLSFETRTTSASPAAPKNTGTPPK